MLSDAERKLAKTLLRCFTAQLESPFLDGARCDAIDRLAESIYYDPMPAGFMLERLKSAGDGLSVSGLNPGDFMTYWYADRKQAMLQLATTYSWSWWQSFRHKCRQLEQMKEMEKKS